MDTHFEWADCHRPTRFLAAVAEGRMSLGRFEEGLAQLREAEALDPRSVRIAIGVAYARLWLRHYPEALAAAERARTLAPANISVFHVNAMIHLAQGDLTGARAVLRAVPPEVDPAALVAYIATANDLYWVLDDEQKLLLLRLSPDPFDNRAYWALCLAVTYALRGDSALARAYADSSRLAYEPLLRDVPQAAMTHTFFGVALAYLGRKAEAIREGERGVALMPLSRDALEGAYLQHALAWIYVLVGEPERALDRLEPLLKIPYYLSPGWLKIDPTFNALRGNPRFERLVNSSQ